MNRRLMAATAAVACAAALWNAGPAGASTVWRVQQVPANGSAQLLAVSCPASGVCFAVGESTDPTTHSQTVLAERWSGGQWAIQPTPTPAGTEFGQFSAISCPSATDCTAIGFAGGQNPAATLVEHWDGTSWVMAPGPDPADSAGIIGLSCTSESNCMAVGLTTPSSNPHGLPFAMHWDGTNWTVTHVPLPAGATSGDLDGGVSCPTATNCVAVGSSVTPNQASNTRPLAERWNGTNWAVRATPIPAGAYNPYFRSVSCTSPARCTAVGGYLANGSTQTPLAERWDGSTWTLQEDSALPGSALFGVSCTSSTSCTAVGVNFDATAEHWDGTSWTAQPLPIPHHTTRPVTLFGVSCVSAFTCTAVGYYGRTNKPLAEHE